MIEPKEPASWQEMQNQVAQILRESGVFTEVERVIQTVRGKVSIDVWAHDPTATPPQTYLIECKRWRARTTQTVVHAFRTVVGDSGANWGAIISATGFQKGARKAAEYSNVRLLSWVEFQYLFLERWFSQYFVRRITETTDPLVDYTEPINSRIFRKADLLPTDRQRQFRRLRQTHGALGSFCMLYRALGIGAFSMILGARAPTAPPNLPLRKALKTYLTENEMSVPDSIIDATSYRSLLGAILGEAEAAIAEFDEVFGERA